MFNHRTLQWMGIITVAIALAGGYFYFSVRAGVKQGAPLGGPAPSNLVGYWSFDGDDMSGTTAYDRSGQGNNGTLTNGPEKVSGKLGQALSFWPNGVDTQAYVNVGDPVAGTLDFGSGDFAASFWMKGSGYVNQSSSANIPLTKRNNDVANAAGYVFRYTSANLMSFSVGNGSSEASITAPTATTNDNVWHHYMGVRSSGTLSLYVDGVSVGSASLAGSVSSVSSFAIGDDAGGGFRNVNGSIDEVRVYNAALTASQVYDLYKLGGETVGASTPTRDSLNEGLAGYWKLDDGSGVTATDSSGNANNGTLTNGPTWGTGQIGGDIVLDGSNDYIAVTDSDALDFNDGEDFSLTGWFYRDSGGSSDVIVDKQSGSYYGYKLSIDSANGETMTFLVRDTQGDQYSIATTATFTTPGWNHVAAVFKENSAPDTKIYINGTVTPTTPTGTISAINDLRNAGGLEIGANFDATQNFIGKLDELRIYRRALSAEEVSRLYKTTSPTNPETGLVGYWSFNGKDMAGTTAYDRSGKGNNGTLTNGPTITEGKIGQAVNFDGSNDYVDISASSSLNDLQEMTFTAWVKLTNSNTPILVKETNGGGTVGFWLTGGYLEGCINTWGIGCGPDYATSNVAFSLNQWVYTVMTFSYAGDKKVHLYINGQETAYSRQGTALNIPEPNSGYHFRIGQNQVGSTYVSGSLDEVRIYNRALSATEIASLYNWGR